MGEQIAPTRGRLSARYRYSREARRARPENKRKYAQMG